MVSVARGPRMHSKVTSTTERWEMAIVTVAGLPEINRNTRVFLDDVPMMDQKVDETFLAKFDKEVLTNLRTLHLQPGEITRICLPALSTMALGPIFILFYFQIIEWFWSLEDYPTLPNINQGVSCFLTPAGLVYAISFGFAFQQAINKQSEILEKMTTEISYLDQTATLISKLKIRSPGAKVNMYKALKAEALYMILQIQKGDYSQYTHRPQGNIKGKGRVRVPVGTYYWDYL